jgi:hypothetical protein
MATTIQELTSRISGLHHSLELTLRALASASGEDARARIETIRDEAIYSFKNSGIPADREMEHAEIVRPAIDVIETVFNGFLRELEN